MSNCNDPSEAEDAEIIYAEFIKKKQSKQSKTVGKFKQANYPWQTIPKTPPENEKNTERWNRVKNH